MNPRWSLLALLGGACISSTDPVSTAPGGADCAGAVYCESFDGLANGVSWPSPWQVPSSDSSSPLLAADVQNGRGRLRGAQGDVTRILLRTPALRDFDARLTISYQNYGGSVVGTGQGIGFYGRQNGGRLTATPLHGQGYAIYIEGGFNRRMGFWHEDNGVETEITTAGAYVQDPLGPGGMASGVSYRVRFQVEQTSGTQTTLRAKLWPVSGSEPVSWMVTHVSTNAALQNVTDGFAVDLYNYNGTSSIFVDDVEIRELN